jgi:hypothetical protein
MPSPVTFNDPFDCRPRFSSHATKAQHRAYMLRNLRNKMPDIGAQQLRREVKELLKSRDQVLPRIVEDASRDLNKKLDQEIGIFCLSARPDHILMWSHYADAHTGLCLRFDAGPDSPLRNARPVRYASEYAVCDFVTSSHEESIDAMIYTKAKEWAYEEEWRIHTISPVGPGVQKISPQILTGVILGARISDADRKAVLSWVRTRQIPCEIMQAHLAEHEYRIEIFPVT